MEETLKRFDEMCEKYGVAFKVTDLEERLKECYHSFVYAPYTVDTLEKDSYKFAKWVLERRMTYFLRAAKKKGDESSPPEWLIRKFDIQYNLFEKKLQAQTVFEEQVEEEVYERLQMEPREYCVVLTPEVMDEYEFRKIFDPKGATDFVVQIACVVVKEYNHKLKTQTNFDPLLAEWNAILEDYYKKTKNEK